MTEQSTRAPQLIAALAALRSRTFGGAAGAGEGGRMADEVLLDELVPDELGLAAVLAALAERELVAAAMRAARRAAGEPREWEPREWDERHEAEVEQAETVGDAAAGWTAGEVPSVLGWRIGRVRRAVIRLAEAAPDGDDPVLEAAVDALHLAMMLIAYRDAGEQQLAGEARAEAVRDIAEEALPGAVLLCQRIADTLTDLTR